MVGKLKIPKEIKKSVIFTEKIPEPEIADDKEVKVGEGSGDNGGNKSEVDDQD